jgi:Ser/Thr protein kinase RdoA (MazF antagonist)
VTATGNKYILRVYRHPQRTVNDIHREIELLEWLKKNNVAVQAPLKTSSGERLVPLPAQAGRFMLLLEYAEGELQADLNEAQCFRSGQALALIHTYSDEIELTLDKQPLLPGWIGEFAYTEVKSILNDDPRAELLRDISTRLADEIESFGIPKQEPYFGLCHADYYPMNVIYPDDRSCVVIDFDLMAHGYRAYDISMFKWCFTILKRIPPADKEQLWSAFLKGYLETRQISEKELAAIDHFVALYQVYLLGARVQAAVYRGPFPGNYWNDNFDYLTTWLATRCNFDLSHPGYPNL